MVARFHRQKSANNMWKVAQMRMRKLVHLKLSVGRFKCARSRSLSGNTNNVPCQFSNYCVAFVRLRLLRKFWCDFYGCTLWDLAHACIEYLWIAWGKSLRRMWCLAYWTNRVLLAPRSDMLSLEYELKNRCFTCIRMCLDSETELLAT